jgi:hypothetical protein
MFIKLFEKFVDTLPIKNVMSKSKFEHSKRVASLVKQLSDSIDVYNGALYHDFLERGGSEIQTKSILSYYTYQLVNALSHRDDEDTLEALKRNLNDKSQLFINDIVIIKLGDRTDNLITRVKEDRLKKKYIKKSAKLIQFLYDSYLGDKSKINDFIENNIFSSIPSMRDRIILDTKTVNIDFEEPNLN